MKYGILYLILSAALVVMALERGGMYLALIWIALSLAVIALGYLGVGVWVYGKRRDGTFALWSLLLHLPYFAYTWGLWQVVRLTSGEPALHQINDDLTIGRRLMSGEVVDDFDFYVDLTSEFLECKAARAMKGYRCFPILDAHVPPVEELLRFIDELKGKVYIHCAQGHGRTGLCAILLLAKRRENFTLDDGYTLLRRKRPKLGLNNKQRQFVKDALEQMQAMDSRPGTDQT